MYQPQFSFTSPFGLSPLLMLVLSACLPLQAIGNTSTQWEGYTGRDPAIWLAVKPVEIRIDAPTPLKGNNLQLLLALSSVGGGLGEIREKARQEFSDYLNRQVRQHFGEFFADEQVHLVEAGAPLTLHISFDVAIRQKILDIVEAKNHETEKGIMTAYGKFRYRLQGAAAADHVLREGVLDLSDLNLKERYRTMAPKDGGVVEDTTREAVERLLATIAEEALDQVEDVLEADALLALTRR
ncbi:hypothetical protein [Microbulbifer pacificus]|uniref:hypothetical protein n=1 Tax=Microbulbifer pacificus TaxID=407164 RepID=UPI000CF43461|nr:hypothetical protein [Microbulbifer pacificus]